MTKTLREKVSKAIYEWQPSMDYSDVLSLPSHDSLHLHACHYEMMADKAIAMVLEHFSDPANVSDAMVKATQDMQNNVDWHKLGFNASRRLLIAAAMRAAAEEFNQKETEK